MLPRTSHLLAYSRVSIAIMSLDGNSLNGQLLASFHNALTCVYIRAVVAVSREAVVQQYNIGYIDMVIDRYDIGCIHGMTCCAIFQGEETSTSCVGPL